MAHLNDEDNTVTYADFVSGTIFPWTCEKGTEKDQQILWNPEVHPK